MPLAVLVFAFVPASVGICVCSVSVLLVVLPFAFVLFSVRPRDSSYSVLHAILEFPFVPASVSKYVCPHSMPLAVLVFAFVTINYTTIALQYYCTNKNTITDHKNYCKINDYSFRIHNIV